MRISAQICIVYPTSNSILSLTTIATFLFGTRKYIYLPYPTIQSSHSQSNKVFESNTKYHAAAAPSIIIFFSFLTYVTQTYQQRWQKKKIRHIWPKRAGPKTVKSKNIYVYFVGEKKNLPKGVSTASAVCTVRSNTETCEGSINEFSGSRLRSAFTAPFLR